MTRTRALIVIIVVLCLGTLTLGWAVLNATNQIQQGRRVSSAAICAVASSIGESGRATIAQGALPDGRFARFLERHGYPPLKVRVAAADRAAQRYVVGISKRVDQAIGHRGDGLVRRNGTLDCARFLLLSHAGNY